MRRSISAKFSPAPLNNIVSSSLRFSCGDDQVELPPGQLWAASSTLPTYRDTSTETLLSLVAAIERGERWQDVVAKQYAQSYPWLHQIISNPARDLFVRQNPPAAGSRILDIGAGWGQISLPLARQPDLKVTALEPTPERIAFIRAAAAQEKSVDRIHFIQAGFQTIRFEPVFDLVCCIGVLEWVPKFQPGEPRAVQLSFLEKIRASLRPGGKCHVGIENRLGLKYLLGARDDHTGLRNVSVFDAALARSKHQVATAQELRAFTYSHAEYLALFRDAGFTDIQTHGAFPDYKLPELILPVTSGSDFNRTLLEGKIPREHDGINGETLAHPEEYLSHYRSLAEMGVAQFFCPSYFFVLQ